jgi:hypothetical protein
MKSATTGAVSGCLVWIIACGVISMCILPLSMAIGGITSVSDFAIRQTGALVCPDNTTPDVRTYATTTTDENGNRQPSTAYVLQCVDAAGNVVKEDPVGYAFLWIGIIAVIGLVLSGVLAFVLAAPAGVLITKFINRMRKPNVVENIEPR